MGFSMINHPFISIWGFPILETPIGVIWTPGFSERLGTPNRVGLRGFGPGDEGYGWTLWPSPKLGERF